jgi:hypothetical protein
MSARTPRCTLWKTGLRLSRTTCTFATQCRLRPRLASSWLAPLTTAPVAATPPKQVSLTLALNALNRSLGKEDLYPFELPPSVTAKLAFVHKVITAATIERAS